MRLAEIEYNIVQCSNRAATQLEDKWKQQKSDPPEYLGFGLYMRDFIDVRTHKKQLRCLRMAEVTSSSLVGSTFFFSQFAEKT
jgi:hypothetical protein